jgi:YfiH family protein
MELITSDTISLISVCDDFKPSSVKAYFTTRIGGVSSGPYASLNMSQATGDHHEVIQENEHLVYKAINAPMRRLVVRQVHHSDVYIDDGQLNGVAGNYDAIISKYQDVLIQTYHADCFPVYFYCDKTHTIGLAHAGWKGVYKDIVSKVVEAMCITYGAQAQTMQVVIGPGISTAAYEVSDELAVTFQNKYSDKVTRQLNNHWHLDLVACISEQLEKLGIARNLIVKPSYCTFTSEKLFFSHRRDGEKTGRMVAMMYLGY